MLERQTSLPPDPSDCEPESEPNTATVTAPAGGSERQDSRSIDTGSSARRQSVPDIADREGRAGDRAGGLDAHLLLFRPQHRRCGRSPRPRVAVSDPDCDEAPRIVAALSCRAAATRMPRRRRSIPATSGSTDCTRATAAPGADCQPRRSAIPARSQAHDSRQRRPSSDSDTVDDGADVPAGCRPSRRSRPAADPAGAAGALEAGEPAVAPRARAAEAGVGRQPSLSPPQGLPAHAARASRSAASASRASGCSSRASGFAG